jgi:hypothetical protein
VSALLAYVSYWRKTGKHLLILSFTGFGPEADIRPIQNNSGLPQGAAIGSVVE